MKYKDEEKICPNCGRDMPKPTFSNSSSEIIECENTDCVYWFRANQPERPSAS